MVVIVQKYGGSSVAEAKDIRHVAGRIVRRLNEEQRKNSATGMVVVVSARGKTTDNLMKEAKNLSGMEEPNEREMAMLLATGEIQACALLAMVVQGMGREAIALSGREAGIITQGRFQGARVQEVRPERIRLELAKGKIVIVAGFQGINKDGETCVLQRGGSDTTAVAIAAALKADICEICTDVDGIFTADPNLVEQAKKIEAIDFETMLALSGGGAKLPPSCVETAQKLNVSITVRSTFTEEQGTLIGREIPDTTKPITAIATTKKVGAITILGIPSTSLLFQKLEAEGIVIDVISQASMENGRTNLLLTVHEEDGSALFRTAEQVCGLQGGRIIPNMPLAKIVLAGAGMKDTPGVLNATYQTLAFEKIGIRGVSSSDTTITLLVAADDMARAAKALHRRFIES